MNIFVGNLSFEAADKDVRGLFEGFGDVASVVIVMQKDKKKPKSRGFGFVEMPDESQAFAAIAALNGREFMGRAIFVDPARPRTENQREGALEEAEQKKDGRVRLFGQPGTYKGGRRSRNYIKRHGLTAAQQEPRPRRRIQDNPLRWRKRKDQQKPWQRARGESNYLNKTKGENKTHKKSPAEVKPWHKSNSRVQVSKFNTRRKPGGYR